MPIIDAKIYNDGSHFIAIPPDKRDERGGATNPIRNRLIFQFLFQIHSLSLLLL